MVSVKVTVSVSPSCDRCISPVHQATSLWVAKAVPTRRPRRIMICKPEAPSPKLHPRSRRQRLRSKLSLRRPSSSCSRYTEWASPWWPRQCSMSCASTHSSSLCSPRAPRRGEIEQGKQLVACAGARAIVSEHGEVLSGNDRKRDVDPAMLSVRGRCACGCMLTGPCRVWSSCSVWRRRSLQ